MSITATVDLRTLRGKLDDLLAELGLEDRYNEYVEAFKTEHAEDEDAEELDFDDWLAENAEDADVKRYIEARDQLEEFPLHEAIINADEFTAYVRECIDESATIDDWLKKYLDYDAIANDIRRDFYEVDFLGSSYMWRA